MEKEQQQDNDRKEYFREYMRKRYQANPERVRAYKKTNRLLKKDKVVLPSPDYCEKFGIYLADVMKIRAMITKMPPDIVKHLLCP